ncbi:Gfo/Idh/MocA family protein [Stratiformator vulcanicus]|uniref:Inositol 2-dehydrogenase n=1 Tax=Stratiformator vulcanicus TaxID=2527980 RepID=A0A517R626_9PLAN|nr:Gfo/Idh/MocA family oxidoreductase [Stratiformator vulcanicus]QDT39354.1 Inositol 2-dehydrogenase [Stratiformator vulcanicus]
MTQYSDSRRKFLKTTSTAAAASAALPYWFTASRSAAQDYKSANERPIFGCIGTGDRWGNRKDGKFGGVGEQVLKYTDIAAVCDVDASHVEQAKQNVRQRRSKGDDRPVETHEDYRRILDRDDIDAVTIVTVDHWHVKIAIEALKAGKDVYCEKPLTLTIDEGRQVIKALEQYGGTFQVGTQQRTEMGQRFLKAIAMVRDGRVGDVRKVTCVIDGSPVSKSIPVAEVPQGLNWDMWLGQCPKVPYRLGEGGENKYYTRTNCHLGFRWWYEYGGGKFTDWGAHHVDIAQWLIDQNGPDQGPTKITPLVVEHPCEMDEYGNPKCDDRFNAASKFTIRADFPNGVEMYIESQGRNGIMIEGTKGRMFVNRGTVAGKPVEDLAKNPLPDDAIEKVYGGKVPKSHMLNFLNCIKSGETPISDVYTHHRAMTTCHLAAISARLNRPLEWDAKNEAVIGDEVANAMQAREQRKGYEIKV